jgi:hypothetical protein
MLSDIAALRTFPRLIGMPIAATRRPAAPIIHGAVA